MFISTSPPCVSARSLWIGECLTNHRTSSVSCEYPCRLTRSTARPTGSRQQPRVVRQPLLVVFTMLHQHLSTWNEWMFFTPNISSGFIKACSNHRTTGIILTFGRPHMCFDKSSVENGGWLLPTAERIKMNVDLTIRQGLIFGKFKCKICLSNRTRNVWGRGFYGSALISRDLKLKTPSGIVKERRVDVGLSEERRADKHR